MQYDETPLGTGIIGDPLAMTVIGQHRPRALPASEENRSSDGVVCQVGARKSLSVQASQGKQKIMQTRQEGALVVRLGDQLVSLVSRVAARLSVVENATAAAVKSQQLGVLLVTRVARIFGGMTRAATTDAHPSNICAETEIAMDRSGSQSSSLRVLCEVHACAGVYKKVFEPLDSKLTSVIRIALLLRSGGAMSKFRRCLREEIASRLDILNGHPPESALAYKRRILGLPLPPGVLSWHCAQTASGGRSVLSITSCLAAVGR